MKKVFTERARKAIQPWKGPLSFAAICRCDKIGNLVVGAAQAGGLWGIDERGYPPFDFSNSLLRRL